MSDFMEIKVLKNESRELVVEFDTKDLTIPDLIVAELLTHNGVEFAGVTKEHPEAGKPRLTLKTDKKKAAEVFEKALEKIAENISDIKSKIGKK